MPVNLKFKWRIAFIDEKTCLKTTSITVGEGRYRNQILDFTVTVVHAQKYRYARKELAISIPVGPAPWLDTLYVIAWKKKVRVYSTPAWLSNGVHPC